MSKLDFTGKVAIVTGGGNGIGRSHALQLAERGCKVVVNDLGGGVDGSGSSLGPSQVNIKTVATQEGGQGIVKTALDTYGRIDIVINNAGILRDKSFRNMEPALLDPVLDVHLRGSFWTTQAAWEFFREQKYGRVVNTSSAAGIFGNFGQTNYGAAKMGIVGLTNVLAIEGAKYNIKVNAIAPGAKTRMTQDLMGPMADNLDMGPELVSPIVVYLAHESCKPTGEIYSVAAGRVGRIFLGATQGIFDPELTAEMCAEQIDTIRDTKDAIYPKNAMEEMMILMQQAQKK